MADGGKMGSVWGTCVEGLLGGENGWDWDAAYVMGRDRCVGCLRMGACTTGAAGTAAPALAMRGQHGSRKCPKYHYRFVYLRLKIFNFVVTCLLIVRPIL